MAQAATGLPWQSNTQRESTVLSEKIPDDLRNDSRVTDVDTIGQNVQFQIPRASTIEKEKQKHLSIGRKRAVSVKPQAAVIPKTREEIDTLLSYGPGRHFNVRTIPPWVRDAEEDDIVDELDDDVLDSPHAALVAQHNSNPSHTVRPGRQERHVMSSGAIRPDKTSRWVTFARSSAYPRENFHGEKVDIEWLNENFTDYSKPWLEGRGNNPEQDSRYRAFQKKRATWYNRSQYVILRNPFVPLAFRFTVIVFAAIAIGLGSSIYHDAGAIKHCLKQNPNGRTARCVRLVGDGEIDYYQDPSSLMAVIIDAIAIVYTIYITYDEYFSKPLGLRPARAKVRLVLLDLFFIIFQSANLSLAFESLTVDDGACYVVSTANTSYRFDKICDKAQALSSVLLVSLVAWLLTFSVSVLRLVERIGAR